MSIAAALPESISAANSRSPSLTGISGVLSPLLKRMASPGRPSSGTVARSTIRSFG